jgi:hypothetical protein
MLLTVYVWNKSMACDGIASSFDGRNFVGCMYKDSDNLYDRGDPGPNSAVIHYIEAVASGGEGSLHYRVSVARTLLLSACAFALVVTWGIWSPGRRCDSSRLSLWNQTGALVLCGREIIMKSHCLIYA